MTTTVTVDPRLEAWARDHHDWAPYLALVREVLATRGEAVGYRATRRAERLDEAAPLLHGAVIEIEARPAQRWIGTLFGVAGLTPSAALDPAAMIEAAIVSDADRLDSLAATAGAEVRAFATIADFAITPMLQSARAELDAHRPSAWVAGHCPICAGWPTLVEARGLDGTRRLRCGRCGGDWTTEWLRCAFCDNRDHLSLDALVPDATGDARRAETCERCRGYLKTIPTLTAIPAERLRLEDLATLDLDVAAVAHGYGRPERRGFPLVVDVAAV